MMEMKNDEKEGKSLSDENDEVYRLEKYEENKTCKR